MIVLGVYFKLLLTVTWLLFLRTDGKFQIPTLNADIIDYHNKTALKFKCRAFTHPKGSFHFLVNNKSVDVMRFANHKCYNKYSECTNESCYCSYKDYSFIWYHNVNGYSINSTFGVVIKIATPKHPEVIMITISGIYDTTAFRVSEILYEGVRLPKEDDVKPTLIPKTCPSRRGIFEKLFDANVPLLLFVGPLWAYAGVLDKSHRESTCKVSKTIHFIGFVIYFSLSLLVVVADINYGVQIGLTALCCPLGMCLFILRNKNLNCCLHSSNAAGLFIVPKEANDQPTKADTCSFNITTPMGVQDSPLEEDSD